MLNCKVILVMMKKKNPKHSFGWSSIIDIIVAPKYRSPKLLILVPNKLTTKIS